MFVFISLEPKARIRLSFDVPGKVKLTKSFKPTNIAGMTAFLGKLCDAYGGEVPMMSSSSVNHPTEYGFPDTFNARKIYAEAVNALRIARAVRLPATPPIKLVDTIEAATKGRTFPLTIVFEKCGRRKGRTRTGERDDAILQFADSDHLDQFLGGILCAQRMREIGSEKGRELLGRRRA